MINHVLTYILVILILTMSSPANNGADRFNPEDIAIETISFDEGVSHHTVFDIYKDSRGLLWLSTMFGLVHYMGNDFTIYRHIPGNDNSLSHNDILKVYEDRGENFWIGTYGGGFNKFNITEEKFTRYLPSFFQLENKWNGRAWDFAETADGTMWITADSYGIIKLNRYTNDYKLYSPQTKNLTSSNPRCLYTDASGDLWLGTNDSALYKYDAADDEFVKTGFNNIEIRTVRDITEDAKGNLWLAADNNVIVYNAADNESLIINEKAPGLIDLSYVNKIFHDDNDLTFIGSNTGIFILNRKTFDVRRITGDKFPGLKNDRISDIEQDESGVFWIGSYMGGLNKLYTPSKSITAFNSDREKENWFDAERVVCIEEGEDFKWICTDNGLFKFYPDKISFEQFFEGEFISAVVKESSDVYWLAKRSGVLKINGSGEVSGKLNVKLSSAYITSMLAGSDGTLWIGTGYGLNAVDLKTQKIKYFVPSDSSNSLLGETIISLFEDSKGNIWAGTYKGLNKLDPKTDRFTYFYNDPFDSTSISNNYVFSYYENANGAMWFGTGGGLNRFNTEDSTFTYFGEEHGLPNPVIAGIIEWENDLYLSTAKGISKFSLSDHAVKNFDVVDGLNTNMFTARAYEKSQEGKLYFGGIGGFSVIDPAAFNNGVFDGNILITSVETIEGKAAPALAYSGKEKITLSYFDDYIIFNFTSLNFKKPNSVKYFYRLEGFDDGWIDNGNSTSATYSSIPAGTYKFLVKTSGSENNIAAINVEVKPPFWQTYWFWSVFVLSAGFVIVTLHRRKLSAELNKAREIEQIRKEEEIKLRKKAADDFHDELGHRITKIALFSELLKRTISDQESGSYEYLRKIGDLSSGLATGVKDFIWTLDPGNDTLYDVAVRLKDFGDDLFDKSKIAFRTSGIQQSFEDITLPMDWRRQIVLIFKEGMTNILKYSGSENVMLAFELKNDQIVIDLVDDGKGFDIDKIKKGRGLNSIRSRAASINGKVKINSTENEGTRITLNAQLI